MISDLEVLTVLNEVRGSFGKLGPDELRASAITASLFIGAVVRYDSVIGAIGTLRRKALVEGSQDELNLTLEGRALVKALGPTQIGQARLETLGKLGESLKGSRTAKEFIRLFAPRVTELANRGGSSLSGIDFPLTLCALVFRLEGMEALQDVRFPLPNQAGQSRSVWSQARLIERKLQRDGTRPGLVLLHGDSLSVIANGPIQKLVVEDEVLESQGSGPVRLDDFTTISIGIVEGFVREAFRRAGYHATGASRRVFVNPRDLRGGDERADSHSAVRIIPQPLSDSRVLLWVEEYNKPWITALEIIEGAGERASEELRQLTLRALPAERVVKFVSLQGPIDLALEKVPGIHASFLDYWAELGFELTVRSQPMLIVETAAGNLSYPAETILVGGPPRTLPGSDWEPVTLTPGERMVGLQTLRDRILQPMPAGWNGVNIILDQTGPTERQVHVAGFPEAKCAREPVLRFSRGATSVDPMSVFELGPEAGRKPIIVRNLYLPSTSNPDECKAAILSLCKNYSRLGFGEAQLDSTVSTISYPPSSGAPSLGELVRRTARVYGSGTMGIAVLDDADSTYYAFKRYYPEYARAPIQAIHSSTVPKIIAGKGGLIDQLCLNLYLKQLGPREAAWSLQTPAGGSAGSSFVAIAFSRALNPQRGGRGVAVLHDATGRGLSWESLVTPGERTITQDWFETVLDQLSPLLRTNPASRLVFYRSGRLDPIEVRAIGHAIERKLTGQIVVDFVSVLNEHRRFFISPGGVPSNPPPGTVIVWSTEEALLAESGFEDRGVSRGSVVPVGLRRVIGRTSIERIAAEYHDLTHLSWSAPYTTWKHPLVMRIADRLAEAAREGGSSVGPKYLPL
jgi:hypothetical protein